MPYIAAIDQGTTSTRFLVFDHDGSIVSIAQREHRQIYPQPGWVEHDAQEIWQRTQQVIEEGLQQGNLRAADIAAVGITNQRETVVLWNRMSGEPVANAIVWQDTRVAPQVDDFSRQFGQNGFRRQTGLPLSAYFSSLKIGWLLQHVPKLREQAAKGEIRFGNIDSFLLWNLTGGASGGIHITDVTNASRTQLMNLETLAWDPELLRTFAVPDAILPRICSSSEIYAEITTGPLRGVPIAGILGDQQAALVGQTCFSSGEAKNTYGTGCFLLMNTGPQPFQSQCGLLTTVAYKFGAQAAQYALEGSIAVTGALVQWLRDNLGLIGSSPEIEILARTVADNGGVYFVPAFSGLYAPHWNHDARGVIAGLTRYVTKAHLARAALEATAFQTREVVEAMERDCGFPLNTLRVDGGMVDNDLLMQFQADILNRTIVRSAVKETTALGAAYAAGLAVGFFKGTDDLRARWRQSASWEPGMEESARERLYAYWQKAVKRSLDWLE